MEEIVVEGKIVSPFKQRFSDAPWFDMLQDTPVLLIGAGGISSWVALCLSRIGCDYSIFDDDSYDSSNIAGQFCSMDQIGINKAVASKALTSRFSGDENIVEAYGRYTKDSPSNEVVLVGVDSMSARKIAFNNWCGLLNEDKENAKKYIYCDGRLLSEKYQIFTVTGDSGNIEKYKDFLFDDNEVPDVMCTLKSTTHCSMGIASDIIGVLTNFIANIAYGKNIREVPFCIEKSIDLFTYEITI